MPSTRALLTGLSILASNIGIISATKFTLGPGQVGGCAITLEDACGCNDWTYIDAGGDCPSRSGRQTAGICGGTVELNFEQPYYQVFYRASESCAVGCDLESQADGASCPKWAWCIPGDRKLLRLYIRGSLSLYASPWYSVSGLCETTISLLKSLHSFDHHTHFVVLKAILDLSLHSLGFLRSEIQASCTYYAIISPPALFYSTSLWHHQAKISFLQF